MKMKSTNSERKVFRVGTDCSGIEAPLEALHQLICEGGFPFEKVDHLFSSEIDKYCKDNIKANYSPRQIYGNMIDRDNNNAPEVDLYVCGFPCQPFSIAGKRGGMEDPRGTVIYSCIDYIKKKKPKFFLLENVKGLVTHRSGQTWIVIQGLLHELCPFYEVSWKVLNTKDYGIPQNRERLFIVGIRKDITSPDYHYEFPPRVPILNSIHDYIDKSDTHKDPIRQDVLNAGMLDKIPQDAVFVDFAFKKYNYPNSNVLCPCITADSRTWCVPMGRYATPRERLALQGFREGFKQVVSNTQMKKQIGNSMSVNVLKALIMSFPL